MTVAQKQNARCEENEANTKAKTERKKMQDDKNLGQILSYVNGSLDVQIDHDFLHKNLGGHPKFHIGIRNGILDLSGVYVLGGAGIDVDWSTDEDGKLIAVIDYLGMGDAFTIAEMKNSPLQRRGSRERTGLGDDPAFRDFDKSISLHDVVATQATGTSKATQEGGYTFVDRVANIDKSIDKYKAAKNAEAVKALEKYRADVIALHDARAEKTTADRTAKIAALEAKIAKAEAAKIDHSDEDLELKQLKHPSLNEGKDLAMLQASANITWGTPDGKPVQVGPWSVGTQEVKLDFKPTYGNKTYRADASLKRLDMKSTGKDGSTTEVGVGEADLGISLDHFFPDGAFDISGNSGRTVSNPIKGDLKYPTRVRDIDVTTKTPVKDDKFAAHAKEVPKKAKAAK